MPFIISHSQTQQVDAKISEIEAEMQEHHLVSKQLEKVDGARTCYRLVGSVLVQRTVGDVLPNVQENIKNMGKVIEQLIAQREKFQKEAQAVQKKHNIQPTGQRQLKRGGPKPQVPKPAASATQGVLA